MNGEKTDGDETEASQGAVLMPTSTDVNGGDEEQEQDAREHSNNKMNGEKKDDIQTESAMLLAPTSDDVNGGAEEEEVGEQEEQEEEKEPLGVHEASVRSCMLEYKTEGEQAAINKAFASLDINQNGFLDRSEIASFMKEAAKLMRLETTLQPSVIEDAVDALMEDVGANITEHITKDQFHDMFVRHPDLLRCFDDEAAVTSRKGPPERMNLKERVMARFDNEQAWVHAHTHWKSQKVALLWTVLYFAANITAFTYKAVQYGTTKNDATEVFGNCVLVARGSAKCINLNALLILLPVCRHFLTRLRAFHYFRFLFPFDAVLEYHMFVGMAIAVFVVMHVSAHICDFHRFAHADADAIFALFGAKLGDEIPETVSGRWGLLLQQRAAITGIIMVICMLIAYPFILVRRTKFSAFWISHHLFLVMLIALCVHGTGSLLEPFQSVYWIMVPLALYLAPRFWRETPLSKTKVLDITVMEGSVLGLKLERPKYWTDNYVKAGMYAFVNIPKISCMEWHPFTLTSAPCDDFIEFHISKAGDWTGDVHNLLNDLSVISPSKEEEGTTSTRSKTDASSFPTDLVVKVEGPIGASSQGFSDYPIVVLVGAGIGVTPMISVLKQLMKTPGKMKKTFLYWTVRNPAAFEWFSCLFDDIFDADQKSIIQIRHFLTSAKHDDRDIGAVLLHHATRARHHKTNFDMLLGNYTHHQVEVGRPVWNEELESVRLEAKQLGFKKCGIFLCGPEKMADSVADVSFELSKNDPDFHFHFSKETF